MVATSKSHPSTGSQRPPRNLPTDQHFRNDRIAAVIVLIAIALLMALMIWLVSLGGGTHEPPDYWPIMM